MQEKLGKEIYSFHKEIWSIDNLPLTQKFWLFLLFLLALLYTIEHIYEILWKYIQWLHKSPTLFSRENIFSLFFLFCVSAVIGGAVVGLLCAILCVMFVVYRMRKKDEGSYALDEPKR